jgi:hypothetical protein
MQHAVEIVSIETQYNGDIHLYYFRDETDRAKILFFKFSQNSGKRLYNILNNNDYFKKEFLINDLIASVKLSIQGLLMRNAKSNFRVICDAFNIPVEYFDISDFVDSVCDENDGTYKFDFDKFEKLGPAVIYDLYCYCFGKMERNETRFLFN